MPRQIPSALQGCARRMERAVEHLSALEAEVGKFMEGRPYQSVSEKNDDTGEQVVRVRVLKPVPIRFSVIVSDVLHNLRSALDNLVWQLVIVAGNTPTEANEFPIFRDARKYAKGVVRDLAGVGANDAALIESFQPYVRSPSDPAADPLWVLHDLSRIDKHRHLHLVGGNLQDSTFHVAKTQAVKIERTQDIVVGPFEDGAVVARFQTEPPDAYVEMYFALAFGIHFEQTGPARGGHVLPTLGEMGERACKIIEGFFPSFA